MPGFYVVPGVYPREIDLSNRTAAISTSTGAAVFASRKGPMGITLVTERQQFLDLYGIPDASWSFGHHSALAFLNNGKQLWVKRVVNDARFAGIVVTNDREGADGGSTAAFPWMTGRRTALSEDNQQIQNLVFEDALVTGNVVTVTLTDGLTPITVTVTFANTSDATLQSLANELTNALNTNYLLAGRNPGVAEVRKNVTSLDDDRVIRMTSPEDVLIYVESVVVTLGTTQAAVSVQDNAWLFQAAAENPGKHGNDIGIRITNVSAGTPQRRKLSFSAPLVTGQSFTATVDVGGGYVNVGPVAFTASNNTTLSAIRTALIDALGAGSDGWVVSSGGANNLEIVLVSPVAGANTFDVLNPTVAGPDPATVPTVAVIETVAGIEADNTFELWVYRRDNLTVPREKRLVSFANMIDGFGRQLFIEEVINTSGDRSNEIRVLYNTENLAGKLNDIPSDGTPIYWMRGGDDGALPSDSDMLAGWQNFASRNISPVRLLINCGYTSPAVQAKMEQIAVNRYDCMAILDLPSAQQRPQDAYAYRFGSLNINSSYAAMFTPDLRVVDEFTNLSLFVPPSGYVAGVFAYNDAVSAEWFAPAGMNRGLVKNIIGLRWEYDEGSMEVLFPAQINPIIRRKGGFPIWGSETMQTKASALSNINVRRLLISIEVMLVDALDYFIYEPHDDYTAFLVTQLCKNTLQPIKEGRGLYDYEVVCDRSNNKPVDKDRNQLNVDVLLKPMLPIKFIRLSSVITKTGAAFNETISLLEGAVNGMV